MTGSQLVSLSDLDELVERGPVFLMRQVEGQLLNHQLSLEQIDGVLTLSLGDTVDRNSKLIHGES